MFTLVQTSNNAAPGIPVDGSWAVPSLKVADTGSPFLSQLSTTVAPEATQPQSPAFRPEQGTGPT